ncbi:hypothetical protein KC345_g3723 [Hortaea werneckii]|nr:hypothetical protein KC345_g3723 [Hortaea werneckii]
METVNEELLRTGSRSDLTIECEGRVFKVHKLIVSTRSPVLARAIANGFQESQTNVIKHSQHDADTMERMIAYIYKGDYQLPLAPNVTVPNNMPGASGTANELAITGSNARLIVHARVYALADYYDVQGLGDVALQRFRQDMQGLVIGGFIYVLREINEIVSKDDTRLRGTIHDIYFRNIDKFANDGSFMTALASLTGLQDLTVGLLREVAKEKEQQKRELERELERKDAEIRGLTEHHDNKAAHTENVLKTFMGVVGKLRGGCPQGRRHNDHEYYKVRRLTHKTFGKGEGNVEATALGRRECSKDTGNAMRYHRSPLNPTMANIYTQSLLSEVAELWRTGEGSDMMIKCEGREFKVHRLLISAASPILKAACQNGMRESQTGVVEHNTFDEDTVERMLEFIYTRDYTVSWEMAVLTGAIDTSESKHEADGVIVMGPMAEWISHTRMYAIGDYYQLPTLKDRALMGVQKAAADILDCELRDFAYVVKEANELIGMHETGFHRIIQDFCLKRVALLTKDKTFVTAMVEVPELQEFAAILLGRVTEEMVTRARESENATATLAIELEWAKWDLQNANQSLEREQKAYQRAMQDQEALLSKMAHYQAVIGRLMDDVGKLPLRCPNIRCGSTIKAPLKLQRQAHAEYGEGTGFVEIKCGRCRDKMSK